MFLRERGVVVAGLAFKRRENDLDGMGEELGGASSFLASSCRMASSIPPCFSTKSCMKLMVP